MKLFKLPTEIHSFDRTLEFWQEFNIGAGDLLFTHRSIWERHLRQLPFAGETLLYEQFGSGEPTHLMIDAARAFLRGRAHRRIIAIGGGAVADTAKFLSLAGTAPTLDFLEKRVPLVKERALVIVPTTCGTGSEVTNLAVAAVEENDTKLGLGGDAFYADYAVLIPELLTTLRYRNFFFSSVDALIHASESVVSPRSNHLTETLSLQAITMILGSYRYIDERGHDARHTQLRQLLLASNYAGIAFGNTGVGAVHALSYPLGGKYHVPHGEANCQFYLPVFRAYDALLPHGKIAVLRSTVAAGLGLADDSEAWNILDQLLSRLMPLPALRTYGMAHHEVDSFTDSVIERQQRLLANNYVELSRSAIRNVYQTRF